MKLSPTPFSSHDRFRDWKFTFEDFAGVLTHVTRQLISDMLADSKAVAGDSDTPVTTHVTFLWILQNALPKFR